jgi:hypothetical protein
MAALALPGACANNPIARSSATRLQKAKKEIGPHRTWQRRAHCLRARGETTKRGLLLRAAVRLVS